MDTVVVNNLLMEYKDMFEGLGYVSAGDYHIDIDHSISSTCTMSYPSGPR